MKHLLNQKNRRRAAILYKRVTGKRKLKPTSIILWPKESIKKSYRNNMKTNKYSFKLSKKDWAAFRKETIGKPIKDSKGRICGKITGCLLVEGILNVQIELKYDLPLDKPASFEFIKTENNIQNW